jgi:signal transduction histidine kinase
VKLTLYLDDDDVRVTCEDNGRGISGDFTEDESDYASGLQDVKELLAQLGGDFKVESSPDEGTKVALSMQAG